MNTKEVMEVHVLFLLLLFHLFNCCVCSKQDHLKPGAADRRNAAEADYQRTQVFIRAVTAPGEYIFIRGGK